MQDVRTLHQLVMGGSVPEILGFRVVQASQVVVQCQSGFITDQSDLLIPVLFVYVHVHEFFLCHCHVFFSSGYVHISLFKNALHDQGCARTA